MKPSLFVIRRFKNRNGVHSFRVTGQFNGTRIRRNFKSQEEDVTEKAHLELKGLQLASNLPAVTTCLTEAQVREAETGFRRLAGDTLARSWSFCIDYTLANHREAVAQTSLATAVTEYLGSKTQEQSQGAISICQLQSIRYQLGAFRRHFPTATVAELMPVQLTGFCQLRNAGLKTQNNRRGILSTFLKLSYRRDWIAKNSIIRSRIIAPPTSAAQRQPAPPFRCRN